MVQEKNDTPQVSIIMPVYNAEPYLRTALDCLVNQTLREIEIICVDDGSTDGSPEILREYADRDDRISILSQENKGAGAARNLGIRHANGEFLYFPDADDLFKPELIEKALRQAQDQKADICVFAAENYDNETGAFSPKPESLRKECFPFDVFSRRDGPDMLFFFTLANPWTKLFRREFILENELTFQEIPNANDVAFVFSALAIAERITVLDEVLVSYRINNKHSLQGSKYKAPLAFYDAAKELKARLLRFGVYAELEQTFLKHVSGLTAFNLSTLRGSLPEFERAYVYCRENLFRDYDLADKEADFFYRPYHARSIRILQHETMLDFALKVQFPGLEAGTQWDFLSKIWTRSRKEPQLWHEPKQNLSETALAFLSDPYTWYIRTCKMYTAEQLNDQKLTADEELRQINDDPLLPAAFSFRTELAARKNEIRNKNEELGKLQKELKSKQAGLERIEKASAEKDREIKKLKEALAERDAACEKQRNEIRRAKENLDQVYHSRSYRLGNAVIDPLSKMRKLISE